MTPIWNDTKRHFGIPLSLTSYELTDNRLFCYTGLLTRKRSQILLYHIHDVDVSISLIQRLFGVGTVTILSSDTSTPKLSLTNIKDPNKIAELLYEYSEKDKLLHRVRYMELNDEFDINDTVD